MNNLFNNLCSKNHFTSREKESSIFYRLE